MFLTSNRNIYIIFIDFYETIIIKFFFDFFNTKIIIESLTINYEPLIWDLNPEGIGVQPMLANVDMSIKFIGGSDLGGCINKLQNALDFNFYANTSVYDARSISIDKNK
jgi:hypothetical protein